MRSAVGIPCLQAGEDVNLLTIVLGWCSPLSGRALGGREPMEGGFIRGPQPAIEGGKRFLDVISRTDGELSMACEASHASTPRAAGDTGPQSVRICSCGFRTLRG